jgi:hypothetical protein
LALFKSIFIGYQNTLVFFEITVVFFEIAAVTGEITVVKIASAEVKRKITVVKIAIAAEMIEKSREMIGITAGIRRSMKKLEKGRMKIYV